MTDQHQTTKSDGWGRGMFIIGAAAGVIRNKPSIKPLWPITCCCGAALRGDAELRDHKCEYLR